MNPTASEIYYDSELKVSQKNCTHELSQEIPVEEITAEETLSEEASIGETPTQETFTEEASAEDAFYDIPSEDISAWETTAQETPDYSGTEIGCLWCPIHEDASELLSHWCPMAGRVGRPRVDHWCPCPHVLSVGVDHWCPCPHDVAV